jgi:hypothetical protein
VNPETRPFSKLSQFFFHSQNLFQNLARFFKPSSLLLPQQVGDFIIAEDPAGGPLPMAYLAPSGFCTKEDLALTFGDTPRMIKVRDRNAR